MLGRREKNWTAVPFFWASHYDVTIKLRVGHAASWDAIKWTEI